MLRKALVMALVAVVGLLVVVSAADDGAALKAKGIKAWKNRMDMNQALVAAQTLEKAAKALPKDTLVTDLAIRSWYWLGNNTADVEKKRELHMKGYKLGIALQKIQPNNVGAYYWTASNISRYAQTLSSLKQKTYFTKINPQMDKVKELDPGYFYGGFNRYMAILTVSISPTLRKFFATMRKDFSFTLEEAETLIKESIKKEPRYLLNYVTLAEIYIEMGKKGEAVKQLKFVLAQDAGALPSEKPENIMEQRRASDMLKELK